MAINICACLASRLLLDVSSAVEDHGEDEGESREDTITRPSEAKRKTNPRT
jgi:hypothetical protein